MNAAPDLLCFVSSAYVIRERDGTFVRRMPTVGEWYCGFEADQNYADAGAGCLGPDGKFGWRDGVIARFDEDGEFYDDIDHGDDQPDAVDMGGYDWLAVQP